MNSQPNTTDSSDADLVTISLGANLPSAYGPATVTLRLAIKSLHDLACGDVAISSLYCSAALDCPPGSADFLNAAVMFGLKQGVTPLELLTRLQDIEADFGRQKSALRNAPRCLDLDIIAIGGICLDAPRLVLPHPRAHQRAFVLAPVAELRPGLVLPGQTQSVQALLGQLPDRGAVKPGQGPGWQAQAHD